MFQLLYGLFMFIIGIAIIVFIFWLGFVILGIWGITGLIIFLLVLILLK